MYEKIKHSLSSIFRMINALYSFFLRFLRYVCWTGVVFFSHKIDKNCPQEKRNVCVILYLIHFGFDYTIVSIR